MASFEDMVREDQAAWGASDSWGIQVPAGVVWTLVSCQPQREGHRDSSGSWVWDGVRTRSGEGGEQAQCEVVLTAGDGTVQSEGIQIRRWLTAQEASALRAVAGQVGAVTVEQARLVPHARAEATKNSRVRTVYSWSLSGDVRLVRAK